jgi:hypothetical protein
MLPHPVIRLVSPAPPIEDRPLTRLFKRLGQGRLTRVVPKTPSKSDRDPFVFLLLADQELVAGRKEQARHLIEAAYEFFDRKATARVFTLHRAS